MKKGLVILMALALVFAFAGMAMAKTETNVTAENPAKGNIVANDYAQPANASYYEQGVVVGTVDGYTANNNSTHVYGTWNSPYTEGIDGYNYSDAQDYVEDGKQYTKTGGTVTAPGTADTSMTAAYQAPKDYMYTSGPHGGYLTSTHRCRECHAVHRAAGKFKLLRSDSRFEACDWCHGQGAGSGYNIQMDNDSNYTTEYNVGHTMGYGIDSGKWKAPDDTYPAFTPNYYMGGFSCFDCHSPHANPARMLGFNNAGKAVGITGGDGRVFGINNPGHDLMMAGVMGSPVSNNWLHINNNPQKVHKPFYLSGSWLLIKNPDREIATTGTVVPSGVMKSINDLTPESNITITSGQEIPDVVTAALLEFDTSKGYPVNKIPTDWNSPIGNVNTLWVKADGTLTRKYSESTGKANTAYGSYVRRSTSNTFENAVTDPSNPQYYAPENEPYGVACDVWSMNEFCTDCHDGNAGLHTIQAPLFSEDRALRGQEPTGTANNWKGSYDLAYGHDANPRH